MEPTVSSGSRIARTAGHIGGSLVLIDLWHSFGWFGAGHWSSEQAATRWPAITGTAMFVIAVLHNVGGALAGRRQKPTDEEPPVTVTPAPLGDAAP